MPTQLMPDERAITQTRQHWLVVAPTLAATALVLIVLIVALLLIPSTVGSTGINTVKLVVGVVVGVAALGWLGIRVLRWRFVTYLLTNRRIVMETGVLSRNEESIPLDRVQNTRIRRPFGERLIGAGSIEIESAGRDGAEVLHFIPGAQSFYTEMLDTMEQARGAAGMPPSRSV